ncbi:MAG: cytidine deaminase [Bdellovibrionota bacterium]
MKVPASVTKAYAAARKVRETAHAPYSKFKVGSALISKSGELYTGCNIENASYGGTVCAERVSILKAVSEGEEKFVDIVVVTDGAAPAFPCALCLQVMAEFFDPKTKIWIADLDAIRSVHAFAELLPVPFGPKQLAIGRSKKR